MRINFVIPSPGLGGGTRVIAIYANLLRQRGHEVTVISTGNKLPSLVRRFKNLLKGQGWSRQTGQQASHMDGLDINWRRLQCFRQIVDTDVPDADVVIATWWETAEWVAALGRTKGAKAYLVQGHEVFDYVPVERAKATYKLPLHKIVVSQWLGKIMALEYGDSEHDIVPNSVDLNQFHAAERGKQSRPTFGFLYSSTPLKSVGTCIAAVEQARKVIPDLRVVCFGAEMPASYLPLPDWIEFHHCPAQNAIAQLYASCDAWLFSSESEGFGLPLLEAMACRTPVIATPAGAAPELLASGGGIPVPAKAPEAINEAMQRICNMPEREWREMSDRAFETASGYTWDDSIESFERALFRAVERAQTNEIAGGSSTLGAS